MPSDSSTELHVLSADSVLTKLAAPEAMLADQSPRSKTFIERNRIALSWACCLSIGAVAVTTESAWAVDGLMSGTLLLAGLAMALVGCLGRIWCSLYIDGFKTAQLVTVGPYSVCRNPLYFFSAVGAIGVALGTATLTVPGLVLLCFILYYPFIIQAEELRLLNLHRTEFVDYVRSTPVFFPRLRSLETPATYQIHSKIVGRSMLEASWFVWFTMLAHLLYQLHLRTEFLPTWFTSH